MTLKLHGVSRYDGSIILESKFTMMRPAESPFELEPRATGSLGPVLELFGKTVKEVTVEVPRGRLVVSFTDGTTIECDSDPKYEAWRVNAPGLQVIAMPGGGEPAVFEEDEN